MHVVLQDIAAVLGAAFALVAAPSGEFPVRGVEVDGGFVVVAVAGVEVPAETLGEDGGEDVLFAQESVEHAGPGEGNLFVEVVDLEVGMAGVVDDRAHLNGEGGGSD